MRLFWGGDGNDCLGRHSSTLARPDARVFRIGADGLALVEFVGSLVGVPVLGIDLREDDSRSWRDTNAMAALVPKDAHVVADHDYTILGMLLGREDITLRLPDRVGTTSKVLMIRLTLRGQRMRPRER